MSDSSPAADELRQRSQDAGLGSGEELTDVQLRESLQKVGEGKTPDEARREATFQNPSLEPD